MFYYFISIVQKLNFPPSWIIQCPFQYHFWKFLGHLMPVGNRYSYNNHSFIIRDMLHVVICYHMILVFIFHVMSSDQTYGWVGTGAAHLTCDWSAAKQNPLSLVTWSRLLQPNEPVVSRLRCWVQSRKWKLMLRKLECERVYWHWNSCWLEYMWGEHDNNMIYVPFIHVIGKMIDSYIVVFTHCR